MKYINILRKLKMYKINVEKKKLSSRVGHRQRGCYYEQNVSFVVLSVIVQKRNSRQCAINSYALVCNASNIVLDQPVCDQCVYKASSHVSCNTDERLQCVQHDVYIVNQTLIQSIELKKKLLLNFPRRTTPCRPVESCWSNSRNGFQEFAFTIVSPFT